MKGIYALYWEQDSKGIYIGQTSNLELRKRQHLSYLRGNLHSNYLVTNMYRKYGEPEFVILETCNLSALNNLEVIWTKEFDSINNGLNIVEPGTATGGGINCSASKFSKHTVLRAFSLLYRTELTGSEIAKKSGMSKLAIDSILNNRRSHKWLQEEYPKQYDIVINRQKLKRTKHNDAIFDLILSTNLSQEAIAKELGISKTRVINLMKEHPNLARPPKYKLYNPEGCLINIDSMAKYCRDTLKLENWKVFSKGLCQLHNEKLIKYRGWTKRPTLSV